MISLGVGAAAWWLSDVHAQVRETQAQLIAQDKTLAVVESELGHIRREVEGTRGELKDFIRSVGGTPR